MQGSHSWEHLQSSMKTSRLSAVTEIVLHNCDPVSSQMGTASWLSTLIQMFSSCTRKGNVAFYKLKIQFPNIITIAVQHSLGNSEFIEILKKTKKNTLSCDYFLFFSDSFKKIYEKYIVIKKYCH